MIPEIGQLCLVFALATALLQTMVPLIGAARGNAAWMSVARLTAEAQCIFIVGAFGCLCWSFVTHDFSVVYVTAHSNSALPLAYSLAAVWGGHEGSMLLWLLMLGFWMLAVVHLSRALPLPFVARILGVMSFISCGFILFILCTSNPFLRQFPAAADGQDLNPLLQDPGMIFHPPMLYMGYVGFCVPFAFAIAALLSGEIDSTWAKWTRPWTNAAWACLSLGIVLGSAWAYYELGWGGWWFWDPVENASFMPWLAGTALIHALAVTEKRAMFKAWTVLLAILTFSLSLLGTFLVRSGVLSSIHAFATDSRRGIYILGFLGTVVFLSLILFAWRAKRLDSRTSAPMASREGLLLINNVVLVAATASILLGTLYPLVLDALNLGKISVGPPFFESIFVPLILPAIFLMGVGPLANWKNADLRSIAVRLRWAALASAGGTALIAWRSNGLSWLSSIGFAVAFWLVAATVAHVRARLWMSGTTGGIVRGMLAALRQQTRGWLGMVAAHLGVAVFIIGVTTLKTFEIEKDVPLVLGGTTQIADYTVALRGTEDVRGLNYAAIRATIEITRNGQAVTTLFPEKRSYGARGTVTTEAAIDTGLTRDLYVSLGEMIDENGWTVRVYYKPFIAWIWGGCFLMAFGGLVAASDRRYRAARVQRAEYATRHFANVGAEPS